MNKSIKKNTILNILKTCSSIIFPLITFPYVSRILLPTNVGKVNFAQAYVNYYSLIATLGIATYAIRSCAAIKEDKEKLSKTASELFSINLIMTFLSYAILFFSLAFYKGISNYRMLIVIESSVIILTTLGADWLNAAMEDFLYITIRTVSFQFIALVLLLLFVKNQDDYVKYAIISVFSASGANLINIWYRRKYCKIKFTLDINWKNHMRPIFFLFVMMLSQTIFNNADTTMLGLMQNDFQVGLYSTAYKITRIIGQVVQSLSMVIIPRLSIYFANNDFENANKFLKKVLGFNLTLGLPMVLGVIMLSNEIIFLVGGPEYMQAVPVIRILILSFMFSLVGGSFLGNAILIPMGKEKYYMIVCCITAAVNVFLNALLIPKYAAVGASISTAFNGFLIMAFLMINVDKRIKVNGIISLFFKPIIGCLVVVLCCLISSYIENVYLKTIVSVLSSVMLYGITQIILRNDLVVDTLSNFKKILKK